MLRHLYTLAMFLATPLLVLRLVMRGVRPLPYRRRWRERFGWFRTPNLAGSLWVHAVSVGEVNAAEALVRALKAAYPGSPVVLTCVTPTGSARVRQLFGTEVFHVYLPYDLPFAVEAFMRKIRPRLALIVETEIWPNLYAACRRRGVPLAIVNARLSERSLRGYRPFRALVREALDCVALIAAQSRMDAARYRLIGAAAERVVVTGNLKFDNPVPCEAVPEGRAMRARWGAGRPVWIAASTHEGENQPVLEAHLEVLRRMPDALLLLAPRHPERFRLVEDAARSQGFRVATWSSQRLPEGGDQVFLIDAMGVLMPFYAAADLALVCGSLVPVGGHNVLEPAALAVPVLVGPYTANFAAITESLVEGGGAERVETPQALGARVLRLLLDPNARTAMGQAGREVFERERGALARVMQLVDGLLGE